MKKIALIISVVISLISNSFAQESNNPTFAIRLGYNYTTINGSEWKSGANFGATFDIALTNSIAFRPGVYYTMKGFYSKNHNSDLKFNFLETPLLAIFHKNINSLISIELQVGPYFAYGISGKESENGVYYENHEKKEYTFDFKTFDYYDRFDWGANAGFGVNIGHLYIGSAFELGFTNVNDHAHHDCLMANIGYTF